MEHSLYQRWTEDRKKSVHSIILRTSTREKSLEITEIFLTEREKNTKLYLECIIS